MLIRDILEPRLRHICFAEADADQTAGAGGTPPPPEGEDLALDDGEVVEETDELEIGPNKYKVPKPIKEAWSGLQKTTQADREALKADQTAHAERVARFTETEKVKEALIDGIADIKGIDKQLEPYLKLTPSEWVAWGQQDPEAARNADLAVSAMQRQRATIFAGLQAKAGELDAKNNQARTEQAALLQRRQAAAEQELAAKIQGWSPEKKAALVKVATDHGVSAEEIGPLAHDYRVMSILEKAAKYDAAVARAAKVKAEAAKAKVDAEPPLEPAALIKSGTGTASSAPRDSDDGATWLKRREAQLAKKGRR